MSRPFPYTYISCPCADTPVPDPSKKQRPRESPQKSSKSPQKTKTEQPAPAVEEEEEEEKTFDPRSPRSNFSLYPIEQLLYCEDCHQIKCPRCITEEIVSWYCPNCLFETPSSMVRSEGNRYVFWLSRWDITERCPDARGIASTAPYARLRLQSLLWRLEINSRWYWRAVIACGQL